eukprot:CAMPEP_0113628970 /NCGR_PEP_ID=MMETSP0017_2-20120614/15024_1 /TAXON_ID=2856 /ORGANISM="Cylindrotheca closterium" /LENGTH=37 /DNA_ID=CAMNT_0000539321 /DNA_START=14 /DNA_END=127 /DNA_ORIENTATION=- /assembly_acc=CAM_ASM_000147
MTECIVPGKQEDMGLWYGLQRKVWLVDDSFLHRMVDE